MSAGGDRDELAAAILAGDRAAIGRGITLVESAAPAHRPRAEALLAALLPHAGKAIRVGITGVPGVGKSTFIETFGAQLLAGGHRLAVLAVDPSSEVSGGSILGDKTRMTRLAADPRAFVRPSPSGTALGGVARATREAMVVLEAAGHDVVLVETVGVGQSETSVARMVDIFLVLMLPGAGDEIQGLKKGVLELADLVAVNKADGPQRAAAVEAARALRLALSLTEAGHGARDKVLLCSALTGEGLDVIWDRIRARVERERASGALAERRGRQQVDWMWALIEDGVRAALRADPRIARDLPALEAAVRSGSHPASAAARDILGRLGLGAAS